MRHLYQLASFAAVSGGLFAFAPIIREHGLPSITPFAVALSRAERGGQRRGKHGKPRHGQKPKSNRLHISKRVRRKHRKVS